jgi:hypothetical protein
VAEREKLDDQELQPDTDLEYDLAHEWAARAPDAVRSRPGPSVYVSTQTAEPGGDYGYDMAHDVPGR